MQLYLVETLQALEGWDEKKARQVVNAIKTTMRDALVNDGDLILQDFGRFTTRTRKERTVNNPRTRQLVTYPATVKVLFTPGQALKDALN